MFWGQNICCIFFLQNRNVVVQKPSKYSLLASFEILNFSCLRCTTNAVTVFQVLVLDQKKNAGGPGTNANILSPMRFLAALEALHLPTWDRVIDSWYINQRYRRGNVRKSGLITRSEKTGRTNRKNIIDIWTWLSRTLVRGSFRNSCDVDLC